MLLSLGANPVENVMLVFQIVAGLWILISMVLYFIHHALDTKKLLFMGLIFSEMVILLKLLLETILYGLEPDRIDLVIMCILIVPILLLTIKRKKNV